MTDDEAQRQQERNAAYAKIKAETDVLMREVDELATRHEPLTNVIPLPRKPAPPPPEPDPIITRMVEELREQLDEHRNYISGELADLLTQVFNDVADNFESLRLDLQSLRNLQNKYVEVDIDELKAETASLRADHAALARTVESLSFELGQLRDDLAAVERSGAGKIVALRGSSA